MTVTDSITRIHFLDLLLRFLKFKEKLVDLHQMLHLVTDGFFDICRCGATYLYRFYINHSLIFSKRLIGKQLFNCNLISYFEIKLCNLIAARGLKGEVRFE